MRAYRGPYHGQYECDDEPDEGAGGLRFEVENASPTPTSLHPVVQARFVYPSKGHLRRGAATFDVRELDRELPPFQAKLFSASARELPPGYGHAWFRVYRFRPRRGVPRRVRIRNTWLEPLNPVRFWFELWRYRLFGRLRKGGPMNVLEYEVWKRSQGPH